MTNRTVMPMIAIAGLIAPPETGAIIEAVALRTTPMFTDNWAMPTIAKSTATLGA